MKTKTLTKREYFAGIAMQSVIMKNHAYTDEKDIVTISLKIADEMIKQLKINKP